MRHCGRWSSHLNLLLVLERTFELFCPVLSRFNKELTSRERIMRHFQPKQWRESTNITISDNLGAISCVKGNELPRFRVKLLDKLLFACLLVLASKKSLVS